MPAALSEQLGLSKAEAGQASEIVQVSMTGQAISPQELLSFLGEILADEDPARAAWSRVEAEHEFLLHVVALKAFAAGKKANQPSPSDKEASA